MTTVAMPIERSGLLSPLTPSTGVSPAADELRNRIQDTLTELAGSLALRGTAEAALAELERLRMAAAEANWDGHGALPLDAGAVDQAFRFIQALPTTIPVPDVSADPDGEVDLLWQLDPTRTISVSVAANGRLAYAALIGSAQSFGTEWLANEIPQQILDNLARVLGGTR